MNRSEEVKFYCVKGTSTQTVTITQIFSEDPATLTVTEVPDTVDFTAGEFTFKIETNYPWSITAPEEGLLTVTPQEGPAGVSSVKVSYPAYTGTATETRILSCTVVAKGILEEKGEMIFIDQLAPNLLYGDVAYRLVKLKDGRIWMAENLRYVPDGKTVSSDLTALDNGLWYPVKANSDGTGGEFDTDEAGIIAKGYLYSTETAFGIANGTITEENAATYEGCQGICPEGWHLPTVTEMTSLVGKCNNGTLTDTAAPYYDAGMTPASGSIALLEADSWPVTAAVAGMAQRNKLTDATCTFGGFAGTPKVLNTGYFAGSSFYKKTASNIQFYGLMPSIKNGNIAAGFNNITNGVSVRCIMDKARTE